ncbi:hypothetical protein BWI75_24120, partial [Gloeocapsopsis sp. AAB1 = 1H9]|nr:hypothetical protein [Gloeocapsopsis dulcis AAB1 = 1H9]
MFEPKKESYLRKAKLQSRSLYSRIVFSQVIRKQKQDLRKSSFRREKRASPNWSTGSSLLSSPINYTVTHLADDLEGISHDRINRYLRGERL